MKLATISIDLDGIACYHQIHGLPAGEGPDPAYTQGLPRFLELMQELGVPATLFAIGRDLIDPQVASLLRGAVDAGHELANHSFSHDYGLTRRSTAEISAEVRRAHRAIERICGEPPRGFRAPGYNLSDGVLDALEALNYAYDSSLFPSPAYFGLRATAIALYALRRQPSRSLVGDPRQFAARRGPYRPRRGALHLPGRGEQARRLLELPVATLPLLRMPYIGTSLGLLPGPASPLLTRAMLLSSVPINLELHLVDLIDASDPGVTPALAVRQRDLRVPAALKIERLRSALRVLCDRREILRLDGLARRLETER
ncbi:MAG: polysaccharide deacetylase family protein [Pseudomonadota bacterium]